MSYPQPYPVAYPPSQPTPLPASYTLSHGSSPHRHAVCRHCKMIVVSLTTLPRNATVTRHFSDARPLSIWQTYVVGTEMQATEWVTRSLAGLRLLRGAGCAMLRCRGCGKEMARAVVMDNVVTPGQEKQLCGIRMSFAPGAVLLSDAYGREIGAGAEAAGAWGGVPAPYGVWPWR